MQSGAVQFHAVPGVHKTAGSFHRARSRRKLESAAREWITVRHVILSVQACSSTRTRRGGSEVQQPQQPSRGRRRIANHQWQQGGGSSVTRHCACEEKACTIARADRRRQAAMQHANRGFIRDDRDSSVGLDRGFRNKNYRGCRS